MEVLIYKFLPELDRPVFYVVTENKLDMWTRYGWLVLARERDVKGESTS